MYLISGFCCVISSILLFFEKIDKFKYEKIEDNYFLSDKDEENKNLCITSDETNQKET